MRLKLPLLDSLPPKRRRVVLWGLGLLLAYTLLGFLILPPIVRAIATRQIARQLDREVSIARVKLNPFALSATIRGLLIKDKDGQPFVSWDEVYVNFQLSSLLGHPWVFREVRVTKPFVRLQVNQDDTLNCSDLIGKFSQEGTNAVPPSPPPALRIEHLHIVGAHVSLTDLTPRTPFMRMVGPVEITLNQFRTDPAHRNVCTLVGETDIGTRFAWNGSFSLDPIRSGGDFSLENLSLRELAPLYQDLVRFDIPEGTIDLRGTYEFGQGASNPIALLTNFNFNLRSLKVAEAAATNSFAALDLVSIEGASVDALAHRAAIRTITASGGRFLLRRNRDASVNLWEAAKSRADTARVPGGVQLLLRSVTNVVAQFLATTNAWQGVLHGLQLQDHALRLEDLSQVRPVQITLDAISFQATNLSNLPNQTLATTSSLRWNSNGTLTASTIVKLFPLRMDVAVDLDRLDLAPLDPYLEPFAQVLVRSGALSVHGRATVTRTGQRLPEARFQGAVSLEEVATIDSVFGDELVRWKSLRLSGIDAQLEPLGASVQEVALVEPRANIIINTNRQINLLSAARLEALNPLLQNTNVPPPRPAPRPQARVGPPAPRPARPKVAVAVVALTNADFQFIDRSLRPFVNVAFSQLTGTIAGLSTEELQRADVHLTGRIGNTAPVEITGKINPLGEKEATDLTVIVKEIDLLPTGPYSGKFLGYRLNKGKLSLNVKYQVSEGKIKASNLIVIDQLTLGEKTGSPEATKLPVRLAIAVLKDRQGRIELDVPVAGTLDDPEFKLGKVISHALLNIITKIATSPFAALGAIFGGKGEEISFQEFAAGTSDLQPAGIEKLTALARGLYERPELQLEIEGSVDPTTDRAALARKKIEDELRAKKWKELRKSGQTRTRPEEIPITPKEYEDAVRDLHAASFQPEAIAARLARNPAAATNAVAVASPAPAASPPPSPLPRPSDKKGSSALLRVSGAQTSAPATLAPADLEGQLLATIEVTENDFRELARARARRVQDYLQQTGQVAADRLLVPEEPSADSPAKGSRVYLHLR